MASEGERPTTSAVESLADRVNANVRGSTPQTVIINAGHADLTDEVRLSPMLPRWLVPLDTIMLAFLNSTLVLMVILIFANTVYRTVIGDSLILGIEEISHLMLLTVAFIGGATAFARGDFMAMNFLIHKAPLPARNLAAATSDWIVILLIGVIGGFSIPLVVSGAHARTSILGISYFWITLPALLGSGLFVIYGLCSLARQRLSATIPAGVVVAAITVALILNKDAAWVATDWFYVLLTFIFVFLLLIGVPIGFVLAAVGIACVYVGGAAPLVAVSMNAQRGTGGFIFLALPFFVLAGFIMDRAGIGARIVEFLNSLIGHVRGGLLQVMIVGVYISSGISGSKASDMATIGLPLNRMLNQRGYSKSECAAVLAAAAAMGESIPPSIAILVLASVTSVSTGALFIAGFLPAATIALCLMLLVYIRAVVSGRKPSPRAPLPVVMSAARSAVLPLLMPVILVVGIVAGIATPTEVSTFAVVYGLGLGLFYGRLSGRGIWQVLSESTVLNGMIFFTLAGAAVFSWALSLESIPQKIAAATGSVGPILFLPVVIGITLVMGALLESLVTIIILGPLLLPVAVQFGIDPVHYGIIMVEAFGIGCILPPIGIALYVACSICGTTVDQAARPLLGYLAVMIAGLLLVAYVHWITLVLPRYFGLGS